MEVIYNIDDTPYYLHNKAHVHALSLTHTHTHTHYIKDTKLPTI